MRKKKTRIIIKDSIYRTQDKEFEKEDADQELIPPADIIEGTKSIIDRRIISFEEKKIIRIEKRRKILSISKIAAIILLACSLTFLFYKFKSESSLHNLKYTSVTSPFGTRKLTTLIDGTTVWLNSGSKLTFSNQFNKQLREVELDGEAFFEVTKNHEKPFIVNIGGLKTKVLGTSFDIQAYANSDDVKVALVTGKIWLTTPDQKHKILTPNQSISYNKKKHRLSELIKANTTKYAAWKDGELIFNNEPLPDVCKSLERTFNLKISIENKELSAIRINGVFMVSDTPKEILEELCKLIYARYKIQSNEVTLARIN